LKKVFHTVCEGFARAHFCSAFFKNFSFSLSLISNKPSHTRQKGNDMNSLRSFMTNNGRFATALATFCLAILLTACGGGGGTATGGGTNPTAPTATGTISASGCTVSDGASACGTQVSWSTENASSPRVTVAGASVSTLASGSLTFQVSLGTSAIAVSDGSTQLASVNVTTTCGVNSAAVNGICQANAPTVLHYTDKVYAVWTGGQLYSVSKTDVKLLTNKTSFTTGFFPLANCWLPKSGPLADGKVLASCQDAFGLRRHYLYIDPTKDELYEYTGAVPANLACTENANKTWACPAGNDWVSVQDVPPSGAPTNSVAATKVGDGWYYNTNSNNYAIFFLTTATGNVTTVKDGTGIEGTVGLLMTFSH
jgi:hypothetical protein